MPEAGPDVLGLIRTYQRCEARKCLPYEGGVLDQPEDILAAFDVIDGEVTQFEQRKKEEQQSAMIAERSKKDLHG
jgi:hypothetical protein